MTGDIKSAHRLDERQVVPHLGSRRTDHPGLPLDGPPKFLIHQPIDQDYLGWRNYEFDEGKIPLHGRPEDDPVNLRLYEPQHSRLFGLRYPAVQRDMRRL